MITLLYRYAPWKDHELTVLYNTTMQTIKKKQPEASIQWPHAYAYIQQDWNIKQSFTYPSFLVYNIQLTFPTGGPTDRHIQKGGAEEVCFKLGFKRRQRRGEADI